MNQLTWDLDLEASFEGDDLVVSLDSRAMYSVRDALVRYSDRHHMEFFEPTLSLGVGTYKDGDPYIPKPGVESSHRFLRLQKNERIAYEDHVALRIVNESVESRLLAKLLNLEKRYNGDS